MPLKLVFLGEEVQTEGACVDQATVVLRREVRMVPRLHGDFTELYELDGLQASRFHEVFYLIFVHSYMLIIEQELLLLLLFITTQPIFLQVLYELVVDLNHILSDPSVHQALLFQVVDVVFDR